ncbi:MAG: DUF420 domain-containing protein [Candidatus Caldarchaeum sp.]|nr:DUF420 domain-containing protein [Candidatus Caldarchaeum sp.]MDW8435104.1 DUF420 domain-containing protein [Candidatus Caldarchaeum sp.]
MDRHAWTVVLTITATLLSYTILSYLLLAPREPPAAESPIVNLLPHAIAAVNSVAVVTLIAGYITIRNRKIGLHRIFMLASFILITAFLVMYLGRLFLGGVKHFTGPEIIRNFVYLPSLFIHLGLSILSVPLVVYNILTGGFIELKDVGRKTKHRLVGRWAVRLWSLSRGLGVFVYFLLNYI